MKMSKSIQIAGVPTQNVDKNSGKSPGSAMWNLRLTLGHAMQGQSIREIEWAPSKETPPHVVVSENLSEEYGPWQLAKGGGWARGGFGADAFTFQENEMLQCPAGKLLWLSEVRQEKAFSQRAVYVALQEDCLCCPLREQCLAQKAKGNHARRVSAVRRLVPASSSVEHSLGILAATKWVDVAGRMLRRIWIAHWRSQYVEILPLVEILEKTSPLSRPPRALRSHHRWSWHDRLACNAWWGPPLLRIIVAGVPAFLAVRER